MKSLDNHKAYQAQYLAQLEQLPYYNFAAPIIEQFLHKIIDVGAFYIRVHTRDLPAIVEQQRIKNMIETGTGATSGGPEVRAEANEALFGLDPSKLQPHDHPKYGYLSINDPRRDSLVNSGFYYQYGSVIIKLKKKKLIHRTTLSLGDSVNFGRFRFIVPTRTDDVLATCLVGPAVPHSKYFGEQPPLGEPLACYFYLAGKIVDGTINERNFADIDHLLGNEFPFFEHIELQYHGILDVATDVESIYCVSDEASELADLEKARPHCEAMGIKLQVENSLF